MKKMTISYVHAVTKLFIVSIMVFITCYASGASKPSCKASTLEGRRSYLLNFGGKRGRYHFKLLEDKKLSGYFAPDFIWDVRPFESEDELKRMMLLLRRHNPATVIGYYSSACTALPVKKDTFPAAKLPLEQCKSEWLLKDNNGSKVFWPGQPDRPFLDMRKLEARQAIISLSVSRAVHYGFDAVCFDNCYWGVVPKKGFVVSKKDWCAAFMKFYEEAGRACHEAGLKCVVNVATYANEIDDAFKAISPFVDGLMTELAFHPNVRTPEGLLKELKGYEAVLKQGKWIFLWPRYPSDEQFGLLAIHPLARKYGGIYLNATGPIHHEELYRLTEVDWNICCE